MGKRAGTLNRFLSDPPCSGTSVSNHFRKTLIVLVLFFFVPTFLLSACSQNGDSEFANGLSTPESGLVDSMPTVTDIDATVETATVPPSPTVTPSPIPPPATETTAIENGAAPDLPLDDLAIRANNISIYPDGPIYDGDLVSIRIDPRIPAKIAPNDVDVRVFIDGVQIVSNNVNWRGVDGNPYGLYQWVWDSDGQTGRHRVIVFLDPENTINAGDESPDNNVAAATLNVRSSDMLSEVEVDAHWITEETECCLVHVVSGTEAHRDLDQLKIIVDGAFQEASTKLGESLSGRYNVYLVDRVFGQGGYAQNSMVVSYLDRDYIGGGLEELLVHEAVHLVDRKFASNPITFLSEGLAVWVAGGHFQQQDLNQRMAALLEIGRFRSLDQAIDDFYGTQHEAAYLQGAGFIEYLVETYGWDSVKTLYSDTSARDGDTLSEAVDVNLQRAFGQNLEQIESDWISYLRGIKRDSVELEDLRTMLRYYDLIRRYQSVFDPMAYYLTTWLPDPEVAQQLGATADFSRRPNSAVNVALEAMLVSANSAYRQGDYHRSSALMNSVERVLNNNGAFLDPLALSYLDIVLTASDLGYEAQQIELLGNQAIVLGSDPDNLALVQIDLELEEGREWSLAR
jgi:hypothetical protein